MRKLWVLAFKEVKLAFRDVGALITMLASPLGLTLVIAAAFGRGGSTPLTGIPVLLLDLDRGSLSETLADVFRSPEVGDLVALETVTDEGAARARVDAGEVTALVIVPPDFTDRLFPQLSQVQSTLGIDLTALTPDMARALPKETQAAIALAFVEADQAAADPAVVEVYANPDARIGTSVVKSIVTQGIEVIHIQVKGITIVVARLGGMGVLGNTLANGGSSGNSWADSFQGSLPGLQEGVSASELPVKLRVTSGSGRSFNWLDYSAVSMSILFLMFAVTSGGRTLLAERQEGTLPRLLVSPTPALTILVGKMGGIVLTGLMQVAILWGATSAIGAYWGRPLPVVVAIVLLVFCATGVGAAISAWAKTPGQAGALGSAITLVGAALSGSFLPRAGLPLWVQRVSLITPNAWGIEVFSRLQMGRDWSAVLPSLGGVALLAVLYYAVAAIGFRRQFD